MTKTRNEGSPPRNRQYRLPKTEEIIFTAMLSFACAYFIYWVQAKDTKNQALSEHKIAEMEKYINEAYTRIYYMRFMDWEHLNIAKAQVDSLKDLYMKHPFQSIKRLGSPVFDDLDVIDTINHKSVCKAEDRSIMSHMEKDTFHFSRYQTALATSTQYYSSSETAVYFFSDNTRVQMKKLNALLDPHAYQSEVDSILAATSGSNISQVKNGILDGILLEKRNKQLQMVVSCMQKEIDK